MNAQNVGAESFASILLNKKNKREAALLLKSTCAALKQSKSLGKSDAEYLEKLKCVDDLMWRLFFRNANNEPVAVDSFESIEWSKWLIGSGDLPEEYASKVREFDDAVLCGLVWTPSFVAYRCRTCSLTPSMSLCADCFLSGNHEGHDFNMFRSQAGGACDCGDVQVMKESGFCGRHGPNARKNKIKPPSDLVCVAEFILPHIFRRLLVHFRETFINWRLELVFSTAERLVDFLQSQSDYGAAMKETICALMLDDNLFQNLFDPNNSANNTVKIELLNRVDEHYKSALKSLGSICSKEDGEILDCVELCPELNHKTFLDEFVFWLVRLEFPQKLVTFLLSMLPCNNYKQALLESFALHYTRIVEILARPDQTNELISQRVIHISVQLLSNDVLANDLVKKHKFLRVLVASLYNMIKRCLIECHLHTKKDNFHLVVDCRNRIMDGHNYWVLASDLHNVINHREVTLQFLRDPVLLDLWCDMISALQGMNLNVRELNGHVEFESRSYYPAFTAEIEICASTIWHLLQHLKDNSTYDCILVMLQNATCQIQEWFEAIQFQPDSCWRPPVLDCCFHLPLHRLYAAFLCQGIKLGMHIPFPSETFLRQLVMHPLMIQVNRTEINCNMWVRNGTSMRYQACLYVQSHFSCAFIDLDIYLLQVCATKINPDWFILTIFERFHLADWLSFSPIHPVKPFLRPEWEMPMLEGALRLIATMITNTINLGATEEECTTMEIATLLCHGDKTHSQILDLLPDKGSPYSWPRNVEQILHDLADYKAPQFEPGGTMSEGIYVPKSIVWEKYFDPLFVMLRSFQVKEFQTAMDRYSDYLKKNGLWTGEKSLWPPHRLPSRIFPAYESLKRLLHCRSLLSVIFVVIFKAVSEAYPVSEDALCLTIYLLELALSFPAQGAAISETSCSSRHTVIDAQFCGWFPGNCIFTNLCHRIDRVLYIDNIPGLSRSCQDETQQGDFPDLIRLRAKLAGVSMTPTAETCLVPSDMPRSRSADIPYIDSLENESDGESDYFYNKAMAFLPPGLRRQYFLTSSDLPALTLEEENEPSTSSALLLRDNRDIATLDGDSTMDFDVQQQQLALQHDQRLAIEGGSAVNEGGDVSVILRPPGTVAVSFGEFVIAEGDLGGLPKGEELKQLPESQPPPHALPQPKVYVTNVGESLLSLLIKLHNKLRPSVNYKPPPTVDDESSNSRVGDGSTFIKRVLDRAYCESDLCRQTIDDLCRSASPESRSPSKIDDSKESRKKAAKERQQRLMAQFTSKQKAVFEQFVQKEASATAAESEMVAEAAELEERERGKIVECVICNSPASSSTDQPIGLVAHTQATCVLAKSVELAYGIVGKAEDHSMTRGECEKLIYERLCRVFANIPALTSTNVGWEGGVYVQTCGHYVHCECQAMYMKAMRTDLSQIHTSYLQVEKGEFFCPLCRQFSNCVLPLYPTFRTAPSVEIEKDKTDFDGSCEVLLRLFEDSNDSSLSTTALEKVSNAFVVHLVRTTYPQFTQNVDDYDAIWAFLCGVLRVNLELVSMLNGENLLQKRSSCIGELLKLLASQVAALEPAEIGHQIEWSRLTGVTIDLHTDIIANRDNEVPLLFQDPLAILIRLTLSLLRNNTDSRHYSTLFNAIFALHVFQICLQEMKTLSVDALKSIVDGDERLSAENVVASKTIKSVWLFVCQQFAMDKRVDDVCASRSESRRSSLLDSIRNKFGFDNSKRSSESPKKFVDEPMPAVVIEKTESRKSLSNEERWDSFTPTTFEDVGIEGVGERENLTFPTTESKILHKCLPFLRVSAILKQNAFSQTFATSSTRNIWSDPLALINYIVDADFSSPSVMFHRQNGANVIKRWIDDARIACQNDYSKIFEMSFPAITWKTPRFVRLPENFDVLFRKFHQMPCKRCSKAPKEMLLCLSCGTTICYRDSCCKSGNLSEIETHTIDCGAGTAVYLSIHSSLVIVTREKRISQWGSLYLDAHGEEDRGLKRGKPLFLSAERLAVLEKQWLSHNYDSTCKRWTWLNQNPNTGSIIIL